MIESIALDLKKMMLNAASDDVKGFIRGLEGFLEWMILVSFYYWFLYGGNNPNNNAGEENRIITILIYAVLVLVLFHVCGSFKYGYLKLTDIILSQWICIILVNGITYMQHKVVNIGNLSLGVITLITASDMMACFGCSYLFTFIYHRMFVPRDMLMVYGSRNALELKLKMEARRDKYAITELLSVETPLTTITDKIGHHDAVILNDVPARNRNDILKYCYSQGKRTYVVPKVSDIILRGARDVNLFDTPLLLVKGNGLTFAQKIQKRLFDIALSLIALLITLPVFLATAIAIKLDDGGPVFFCQNRVTLGGRVFKILKFRSMIVDAEKDGKACPATDGDDRITRVGRVIRALRIDELPQLLNVIVGDMSICGPRPERCEHHERYCEAVPEFDFRTKVRGGLTGYAQIYGKYNTLPYDKIRLDLMYIENYSFLTDIKLVLLTLRILLKKDSTEGFDKIANSDDIEDLLKRMNEQSY